MSDHLNNLEEKENTVKSRNKLSAIILIAVYLGIWTLSLLSFWMYYGNILKIPIPGLPFQSPEGAKP